MVSETIESDVSLRPVCVDDEEFILKVYASSRADEMALVDWSDEQKAAFLRSQSNAQREQYTARFPDAEYSVVLVGEKPAGRLWIGRDDKEIRLLDIAILPEFQNRGVGSFLLRRLIEDAKASGKPLRHMVFKLNPDAHRFYERFGFRVFEDFGAYLHMELPPEDDAAPASSATESATP